MATRCQKIISVALGEDIVKTVCNSNNRINRLHFNDPGGKYSIDVSCCQKCSDLLYNSLSWSQRMWQADTHLDYESKQKELREIRWNHCRKCLHPDMEIVTKDGLKKISDIVQGDMVLTHKGRLQKVLEVIPRKYEGELTKISLMGANKEFPIVVTPDHMMMVKESYYDGKSIVQKRLMTKMAGHLKTVTKGKKDYIIFPRIKTVEDIETESIDMMIVYGYYLSEGTIFKRKNYGWSGIVFSFGKSDKEYQLASELVLAIKNIGFNPSIRLGPFGWVVRFYSSRFTKFIKENFNQYSYGKRIPFWVKNLPTEKLHVLFDCYIKGDGYKRKGRDDLLTASTTSKQLCLDLRDVALKLGYTTSLSSKIYGNYILERKVNTRKSWRMSFTLGSKAIKNDSDYVYLKVRSIEKINYSGLVYDLVVDNDHTFCTAYGTVHNCNHPLDCHCKVCKNEYEEIWSLVFFHSTGRFRAAFHLHRKCCREVMASVGEDFLDIGSGPGKQTIFENFKEYEFEEPKPLGSSDSNQRIQRPIFKICRFPGCEAQVEVEKWHDHQNLHRRYDSTDKVQEQFLGKHIKKEEVMVCEKHSKRAVRGPQGFMICPTSGCTETLKPKMLPVKIEFDPLMCVYHQSELKYDSAQSKLKCGVEGCDMSYCMRKSYLIAELRQGYITGRDGVKVPFDPEHRAVILDGKTVILKII